MDTLGFFLTELMILWEQVSEAAGLWTVSHIPAAEQVSICQPSTTVNTRGLTARPDHGVKPHYLHPQQKLNCSGVVPCCVPLCPGSKQDADPPTCNVCAWLCSFLLQLLGEFSIQSRAGGACSHEGLWTLAVILCLCLPCWQ